MTDNREELRRRIVDQLTWDSRLDADSIIVELYDSTVRLAGQVRSQYERRVAEADVWSLEGVMKIRNDLEVRFPPDAAQPSDHELRRAIINALQWHPGINAREVDVIVEQGIVTLHGSVDSYWMKMLVEEVAADITGVIWIVNMVTVVPTRDLLDKAIADRIVKALDSNPIIPVQSVDVTVERGVVTLTGSVPEWHALKAASRIAAQIMGVRDVINHLVIMSGHRVAGMSPADARIRQEIEGLLQSDARIDPGRVSVQVDNGTVHLSGTVDSLAALLAAESAARIAENVREVDNRIEIEYGPRNHEITGSLENRVHEALRSVLGSSGDETISVSVDEGMVTLGGSTGSMQEKEFAGDAVRAVGGITQVIDRIAIVPTGSTNDRRIAAAAMQSLEAGGIRIEYITLMVENGVVTIKGKVPHWNAHDSAGYAIAAILGVQEVRNELLIT